MFSGPISTGPLMRKGLADIKLVLLGALPIIVGGMSGSMAAIYLASSFVNNLMGSFVYRLD